MPRLQLRLTPVYFEPLSEQASNLNETVEAVRAALDETERAQSVAMSAIQLAQNNTRGTMDLLVTVSLGETRFTHWELMTSPTPVSKVSLVWEPGGVCDRRVGGAAQ